MKHGDFVTNCYGQARALGTEFARFHGRHDTDEWVSLACFQLVMAAQKFTAPEQYAEPSFWAFAKAFIWRRLTDALRTETNRGKRDSQGLDPSTPVSHDFTRRSDAAVTLSLAMPFLTKTQKRWLDGVLLLGVVTEADAEVIGMKLDAFRWHRRHTILRIREVLS